MGGLEMTRYGLFIDSTKCINCHVCTLSCKDEFVDNDHTPFSVSQPDTGHFWINVIYQQRGGYPNVELSYLPTPCMHCDNPPCMAAYPDAIYKRPDGIVIVDPTVSTDRGIVDSCPYGTIYWNEDLGIGQKCTMCVHRVEEGVGPKCVLGCPVDAIIFGDLDDPNSTVSKMIRERMAEPLHPEWGAEPKVFYIGAPTPTVAGYLMDNSTKLDVEDITVTLTNLLTGETVMAKSDHAGNFRFEGLENGRTYTVRVEAPGYYPRMRLVYVRRDGFRHIGTWRMLPKLFPK